MSLQSRPACQCIYEIINNLERTKYCSIPCRNQRENVLIDVCDECNGVFEHGEYDSCPVCVKNEKI